MQSGRDPSLKPRSRPLKLSVEPFWYAFCQSTYFSRAVKMSKKTPCTSGCLVGGNLHEKRWTFWLQRNLSRDRAIKPRSLPLNLSVKQFWLGFCQSPYFSRAVKMSKKPFVQAVAI